MNQQAGNTGSGQPSQNPHWKPILDQIPEMYHSLITPKLQEWDQNVNQRFQEINQQYSGYKEFIDNKIDPQRLAQTLEFVNELEQNPDQVIRNLDKNWNLNLFQQPQIQQQQQDPYSGDPFGNNPPNNQQVQQPQIQQPDPNTALLLQQMQQMQQRWDEMEQSQQEQAEQTAYEQEINNFLSDETRKHVDPTVFSSFRAAGLNNEQALEKYNTFVAGLVPNPDPNANQQQIQQQQQTPPNIMGGGGNVGSGTPIDQPKMGELGNRQVSDIVSQFLNNANAPQ